MSRYLAYTRLVVGGKARELYTALCDALDGTGGGGGGAKGLAAVDFVGAMTGLFRELAMAAEQDEKVGNKRMGLAGQRPGGGGIGASPLLQVEGGRVRAARRASCGLALRAGPPAAQRRLTCAPLP